MTAKEALRELVDEMSESEAENWLKEIAAVRERPSAPAVRDDRPIWEKIRELADQVPPEEWAKMPSSDRIDDIVYAQPRFPGTQ
ncbi:MAG: hypothetical protein C0506_05755 [Anaerolinea sp.]|nr:hypothetical protein [Anaerolinea sp.]